MAARCKEKGSVPPLRIALEAPSFVCQNGYCKGNRRQHDTNSDRTAQRDYRNIPQLILYQKCQSAVHTHGLSLIHI